jgi:hypothetical protein
MEIQKFEKKVEIWTSFCITPNKHKIYMKSKEIIMCIFHHVKC